MKFQDLKQEYKCYALVEHGMRPKTHKSIVRSVEILLEYLHTQEVEKVTEGGVRTFLQYGRQERGWSPNTYRIYWQYIRLFFKWCKKRGYINIIPTDNIEKPKLPQRIPRYIDKEDARKILYYTSWVKWYYEFEKPRNEAIISMLLMTGLRASELLNLENTDVNLQDATILVRNGKGAKDRLIPIHYRLLHILNGYVKERQRLGKPSRWFFTGVQSDKQLGYKNLRRVCQRVSKESQVKFTAHMLRHTFCREMLEGRVPIYDVKEMMGHKDISTTQIYASISIGRIRENLALASMY